MSLAAIVDRVADLEPTNIAISGTRSVTYRELKALSLQISTALLADNCRRIGIFLPSSIDFFVSLVGINRIGSAFVPLDPTLPTERLRQMVERAGIDAIISSKNLADSLSFFRKKVFFTEAVYAQQHATVNQQYSLASESLCYVIFTSGSTGHPKGCMVSYRNLDNYIQNAKGIYSLNEADRVLQFASISFDTFLEETCCAWGVGATLVLKKNEKFSSHHELLRFVDEERISVLDLPSSLWHSLVDELEANKSLSLPSCLTTIIVGGEGVSRKHLSIWLSKYNRVQVINTYGISECAIVNSFWKPTRISDLDNHDHTPIGKPLDHVSFVVLDEQGRQAPVDKAGELYISGACVGDGYIRDDELTQASFITDVLHNGSGTVFYRTGDVVKLCSDGLFECVGRIGSFININGIRVDLGEIENVIKRFPGVQDCKVIYSKGNAGIHAFIKSQTDLGRPSVVTFAQQYLPAYMIPKTVFFLAEFPVNRHGKISERELLRTVEEKRAHGTTEVALTEVQEKVKGMFQTILQRDDVGLNETFFALGGDSINSMNLLSQIEMTYDVDIPIEFLFGNGTILGLAEYIENFEANSTEENAFVLLNRTPFKDKTILLIPGSLGDVLCYSDLVKDLQVDNPIYGTSYPGRYNGKKPLESLTEYAQYYADSIQGQELQEPFVIAGYSSGGWIAYALASELLNRNVKVESVFLLDSAQPNFVDPTSRKSKSIPLLPPLSVNLLWFLWALVRLFGNELVQNPRAMPMLLREFIISGLRSGKLWKGMAADEVRVDPTYLYTCARLGFFGRELSIPAHRYGRADEKGRFGIILQEGKKISLFPDAYTIEDIEKSWQIIMSIIRLENIDSLPSSKNRLVLIRTKPHYGLRMFFPAGRTHDFGWGRLVDDQVKVFEVEGTHLDILRRPSITKVAEIMRAHL